MKVERSAKIAKMPVNMQGAKGAEMRQLITKADGAPTFAMRMFEIEPGGHTPMHRHPHEHEVFVLEGAGTFLYEGRNYPITQEDVVFVPGDSEHCFKNTGNGLMRFLCLVPLSGA
jgi:quercetin dioxygenase-like cupin family protein